jgi:hypothetical protein
VPSTNSSGGYGWQSLVYVGITDSGIGTSNLDVVSINILFVLIVENGSESLQRKAACPRESQLGRLAW